MTAAGGVQATCDDMTADGGQEAPDWAEMPGMSQSFVRADNAVHDCILMIEDGANFIKCCFIIQS